MTKNFIQCLHCGGHGVFHRAAVRDNGVCRREIQGAALRLHLFNASVLDESGRPPPTVSASRGRSRKSTTPF